MKEATRSPSLRNRPAFLLSMALALVAGACSVSELSKQPEILQIREIEALVWNNRMPGSKPNGNVLLRLLFTNISTDSLVFPGAETRVFDNHNGQPLLQFPSSMLINEQQVHSFALAPGDSVLVTFRPPVWGLTPFDPAEHPQVRISVRLSTTADYHFVHTSDTVTVFETQ